MTFTFKLPPKRQTPSDINSLTQSEQVVGTIPTIEKSLADESVSAIKPLALKPIKSIADIAGTKSKPTATPVAKTPAPDINLSAIKSLSVSDDAMSIIDSLPEMSYKDAMKESIDLDALAREFQNDEQPEKFDDAATEAIHKAVNELEKSIDNAEEVRTQLTFIMNELHKYPQIAAKICDRDIHVMVKALRQSYNTVAFTKKINKTKKESATSKSIARANAILDDSLFEGLGI